MKRDIFRFFVKFLFLFISFMTFVIYCEIKLREVPTSYSIKRKYFEKNLDSIQVLFLGSSESLDGINPKYFDLKGFNLSSSLQSLYYDKELTLKYINRMPHLKYVFISVSYFSLWFELYNSPEKWLDFCYYHYWDIKPNDNNIFDLKKFSFIALFGLSYTQNAFKKNFNVPQYDLPTENGWCKQNLWFKFNPSDSIGKFRVSLHNNMMRNDLIEKNISYLETILDAISARNIKPVFVSTPAYKTYIENTDPVKIKTIEEVINRLCNRYHCKYYNYLENQEFSKLDFADDDHLNLEGSEKLSKKLNYEISNHP